MPLNRIDTDADHLDFLAKLDLGLNEAVVALRLPSGVDDAGELADVKKALLVSQQFHDSAESFISITVPSYTSPSSTFATRSMTAALAAATTVASGP